MMMRQLVFVLVTTGFLTAAQAQPPRIRTDEDPSLWQRMNPANWKMPKVTAPKFDVFKKTSQKRRSVKRKPGFWQSLSNGTKNTWRKTTGWLNPFDNKPAKREPGFFTQLFSPKEEPEPIDTVGDFLSQPFPY